MMDLLYTTLLLADILGGANLVNIELLRNNKLLVNIRLGNFVKVMELLWTNVLTLGWGDFVNIETLRTIETLVDKIWLMNMLNI